MEEASVMQTFAGTCLKDRIRRVVKNHAGIRAPLEDIKDSTDLYRAGMSSHSSVLLMVALENEFNFEFPDGMLSRDVFENIDTIANAIESVMQVEQ
jgi:acyl carrier protein